MKTILLIIAIKGSMGIAMESMIFNTEADCQIAEKHIRDDNPEEFAAPRFKTYCLEAGIN